MPAVTVDDITVLPRVPVPDPVMARQRPVTGITTAPRGFEGEGFPVRRAFAGADLRDLDPFIHLDQMGEIDYGPGEPKGTPRPTAVGRCCVSSPGTSPASAVAARRTRRSPQDRDDGGAAARRAADP
jgi:hypothetical protein